MQISINDYLKTLGSRQVLYVPNPGNAGDSVIAAATYQTFDRAGLNYKVSNPSLLNARNNIVIYGGGGNLVQPTSFSSRFASTHHHLAEKFIILPHTLKNVDALLSTFGGNVDIICREKTSYAYAKEKAPKANVFLAQDMAFYFDTSAFLKETRFRSPSYASYIADRYLLKKSIPSWTGLLKSKKVKETQKLVRNAIQGDELNCFREDGESKGKPLPPNNFDLSLLYDFGAENPEIAGLATQAVLNTLKQFSVIHTDRLHMAISGALLGLTVHFYANNYFKCKAVYEHSIAGKFPNVIWHDD